jgi:hypothetical protein
MGAVAFAVIGGATDTLYMLLIPGATALVGIGLVEPSGTAAKNRLSACWCAPTR